MKQEISLVRLGAGVPEVWYEVNMCGEFSKESESGTKRVRTVLIRTVSDNIKLRKIIIFDRHLGMPIHIRVHTKGALSKSKWRPPCER